VSAALRARPEGRPASTSVPLSALSVPKGPPGLFPLRARHSLSAKAGVPAEAGATSRATQQRRPRRCAAPKGLVFHAFAPGISRCAAPPGSLPPNLSARKRQATGFLPEFSGRYVYGFCVGAPYNRGRSGPLALARAATF
jgi:hypothetical protein